MSSDDSDLDWGDVPSAFAETLDGARGEKPRDDAAELSTPGQQEPEPAAPAAPAASKPEQASEAQNLAAAAPEPDNSLGAQTVALSDTDVPGRGSEGTRPDGAPASTGPASTAAAPQSELDLPTKEERNKLFDRLDVNGNGGLSLAEIDKGVIEMFPSFNCKPALMRAYKAADRSGDGFIERREFRLLLQYLVYFNNLFHKFEEIDANHDRRLALEEFVRGCAVVGVAVDREEAEREFAKLDDNSGGYVLFDEFCVWCAHRECGGLTNGKDEPQAPVVSAADSSDQPGAAEQPGGASLPADEHLVAMPEDGQGAGMYRCLHDAGVTSEFELTDRLPTMLRRYSAGTTFYASEICTTSDGRERARAADGGWISLVSGSGLQLLEPTGPIGYFRCVGPAALVTASLNGTGQGPDQVRRLDNGDEVLAVGEAVSSNGARRLRLEDGWVSVVNKKGVLLMAAAQAETPGSRAAEDSLLQAAQEFVREDAPSSYTNEERGEAAARIQARVRGNDARVAFEAKRDALQRELSDPRASESVACVTKLWHEMCEDARQAAENLGWTASSWDHGICPVKYWESLGLDERRAARFLGFTQPTWDNLGVAEADATAKARGTTVSATARPPSVAACVEALCMLDPSFRQKVPTDTANLNIERVDALLEGVRRANGALAAESTELLKLLRIAVGGGTEPGSKAKPPVHHRLFQQQTRQPRKKIRSEKPATPTRPAVRKPVAPATNPSPLPRDNPFASPATSKGYRTLYPDVSEPLHHHPFAGMGSPTVLQGLSRNHADMERPDYPLQSADHEKTLTPWKEIKVKREPLRHVVAQQDRDQAKRRREALNRRVQAKDRKTVEGPGMFGTAPRCRGEVAHTTKVREKPGHDIEGHARSGRQYVVDETRRENAEELLVGLKKLKGIDLRPWKGGADELAELSEEERSRRSRVTDMLGQLIQGNHRTYWKMIRDAKVAFAAMDADENGTLGYAEFMQALNRLELGATNEQAASLFKAIDYNNDGAISCYEFLTYLAKATGEKEMHARAHRAGLLESKVADTSDAEHEASVCHQLYIQALESPAAVFCDARALVTELLDHGADGLLRSTRGETALCKAVAGSSWSFARKLIARHGASELLLLAAQQRLSWARASSALSGIWAKHSKLDARITQMLETIGEPSQVNTVGSSRTLTTLSLMSLPDWVAQCYASQSASETSSTSLAASEDSSRSTPRYMRATANAVRRVNNNPWRAVEDHTQSLGGSGVSSSRGSSVGQSKPADSGARDPLKSGKRDSIPMRMSVLLAGSAATRPLTWILIALLDYAARELAIKVHHPTLHSSTERARKLAQQGKKTPVDASNAGSDDGNNPVASPHQRSLEDFWSVHGKVHARSIDGIHTQHCTCRLLFRAALFAAASSLGKSR